MARTKRPGQVEWARLGPLVEDAALAFIRTHGERGFLPHVAEMFAADGVTKDRAHLYLDHQGAAWKARKAQALAEYAGGRVYVAPPIAPANAAPVAPPAAPEPPPLEADHPELRDLERRLADAQREARQLRAKLKEADADRTLFDQLAAVIRQTTEPLKPRALTKRTAPRAAYAVDGAVALTDEHGDALISGPATWGLEVYDFNVFRARLQRWAEVIAAYLTDYLPRHHFERLWVFGLGDSVHGDIHDHKYRNHFGNSLKAALAVGDAEAEALAWIHETTGVPLHLVKVSGNHPRQTKRKDFDGPHDNLDYLVATQIATRLERYREAERITVHAPASWSAYVEVRGKVQALNHGDDVKGFAGFPWYGFSRKHNRIQALLARHAARVDFFWHGHYHTDVAFNENHSRSIHSGAFTLTDPFAVESVAAAGEPTQSFVVFNDDPGARGRILEIPVYLRDERREAALRDGEWEPQFGQRSVIHEVSGGLAGAGDDVAARGGFPLIRAGDGRADGRRGMSDAAA